MDSFKKVFYAIKKLCKESASVPTDACFERIKEDLHIDKDNFDIYLTILQNMRLVDCTNHVISLTELGKKTDTIPSTLT